MSQWKCALEAAGKVRLISAVTPVNAESELERLRAAFARGRPGLPRWEYAPRDVASLDEQLRELSRRAGGVAEPLRALYGARVDELRLEARMVGSVGRAAFGGFAAERHRERAPGARAADTLAARWAHEHVPSDDGERIMSDAPDARSLLSQVRAAIGAHRVAFAVRPATGLMALAATGERTVYVARGRALSVRTATRVALHEVSGHVLPRVRATMAHAIFALGTARGTDDQEGLALLYEERAGLLDPARRVELARRHIAARTMRRGADFVEVVRNLRSLDPRVSFSDAIHITARAFRGSTGSFPGLARESAYIPSFLRVASYLRQHPRAELTLASGQVAISALTTLHAQFGKHASPCPLGTTATV